MAAALALVELSAEEIAARELAPATLAAAVSLVELDGYCVLVAAGGGGGVMEPEWCARMTAAWERHMGTGGRAVGEEADPWSAAIMDPLAVENPWALQVMEAMMPDMWAQLPYWTNVASPGQTYGGDWQAPGDPTTQAVHRDQPHLFPEADVYLPPHALIQHITLCQFTDGNGSTELWPKTHRLFDTADDDMGGGYSPQRWAGAEARAASVPSLNMNCPAGSIMVRDMRMWHRARPNTTDTPRPMLSYICWRDLGWTAAGARSGTEYGPKAVQPIPPEAAARLSERGRVLARYNIAAAEQGRNDPRL